MAATDASSVVKKKQRLIGGLGRHNYSGSSCYFNSLPEEITLEILLRLTAEDLSSCKCVSKLWSSFIYRPTFGNAHLLRSTQRQQEEQEWIIFTTVTKPTNIIPNYLYNHFSISLTPPIPPSLNPRKDLKMPFHKLIKKWSAEEQVVDENDKEAVLCLKAHCDGLLLFQNKYNPLLLYISNPITSHFQALPPTGGPCSEWALFPDAHSASVGKYKVFGILGRSQFRTLTVRTGDSGKKTTPPTYRWMSWGKKCDAFIKVTTQIILVQNHLFWLTIEKDDADNLTRGECYCLYMLDVKARKPTRKQVPRDLVHPSPPRPLHNLLSVLNGGSLCLTLVSAHQLQMFVLHDTLTNVWTRSHCIRLQSLRRNPPPLTSFLSENTCLVTMRGVDSTNLTDLVKVVLHLGDELLLYDLGTRELRQIGHLSKDQKLTRPYYFHSNTLVAPR